MKFRLHKLIAELNSASKQDTAELLTRAIQNANDYRLPATDRVIWRDVVTLLRKHLKRY